MEVLQLSLLFYLIGVFPINLACLHVMPPMPRGRFALYLFFGAVLFFLLRARYHMRQVSPIRHECWYTGERGYRIAVFAVVAAVIAFLPPIFFRFGILGLSLGCAVLAAASLGLVFSFL